MATRKQLRALAKARAAKKRKNKRKSKSRKMCEWTLVQMGNKLRAHGYKVVKK